MVNKSCFTPTEVSMQVVENNPIFEFTGYVSTVNQLAVFSQKNTGKENDKFQFIMSNGDMTVQFVAWGEMAKAMSNKFVKTGEVLHFQKITPSKAHPTYLKAKCSFKMHIRSAAKMKSLGMFAQENKRSPNVAIQVQLQNLREYENSLLEFQGFILMNFEQLSEKRAIYIGTVMDGTSKVTLLLTKDKEIEGITVGANIKVKERLIFSRQPHDTAFYVSVQSVDDITVFDDHDQLKFF